MKKYGITVLGIVTIFALVIFISGCINTNTITFPETKNVAILNSTSYSENESYVVKGELQNNNPFGVAYVKLKVTGYDGNGNIIASDSTYAEVLHIPAGGKSTFDKSLKDPNNKIVRHTIEVLNADKSKYAPETSSSSVSPSSGSSSSSGSKFPITLPEGMKVSCPNCGSFNNVVTDEKPSNGKYLDYFKCNNCGHTWSETFSTSALGELVS